jgi:succinylarginine dihydrolase
VNEVQELNLDGMIGLTHHYAGLSPGNLHSISHKYQISRPQKAAMQGFEKMQLLMDMGIPQAVMPPQERPYIPALRAAGYAGTDSEILSKVYHQAPGLLSIVSSASSMWCANAATVSPSVDTGDSRVHFTPANLVQNRHRALECEQTARMLKRIFSGSLYRHHEPIRDVGDEGAANHMRLCEYHGGPGIEVFIYGQSKRLPVELGQEYPVRQYLEASRSISRHHRLRTDSICFIKQNRDAIRHGVFHNDVIAVSNKSLLLIHELAWENQEQALAGIQTAYEKLTGSTCIIECIPEKELSIKDAVESYFFNSQIVSLPKDKMAILAPLESQQNPAARACFQRLLESPNPINKVHYIDIRQSMKNGGGPACLRLRVVLTPKELSSVHRGVLLTPQSMGQLKTWVKTYYPDSLVLKDLASADFLQNSYSALDELTQILQLGPIYSFQQQ